MHCAGRQRWSHPLIFAVLSVLSAILFLAAWLANMLVGLLVARTVACVHGAIVAVGNESRSLFRRIKWRRQCLLKLDHRQVCSNAAFPIPSLHDCGLMSLMLSRACLAFPVPCNSRKWTLDKLAGFLLDPVTLQYSDEFKSSVFAESDLPNLKAAILCKSVWWSGGSCANSESVLYF